jgi:hypothetical protein
MSSSRSGERGMKAPTAEKDERIVRAIKSMLRHKSLRAEWPVNPCVRARLWAMSHLSSTATLSIPD